MLSTLRILALRSRGADSLRRGGIVLKPYGLQSASTLSTCRRAVPPGVRRYSSKPSKTDSPIGVAAAQAANSQGTPASIHGLYTRINSHRRSPGIQNASKQPTLFMREFSLNDRIALVSGGNSGIGLEAALGFLEAGARAVYCIDLPQEPSDAWRAAQQYASSLQRLGTDKVGRLEYVRGDVTDQVRLHAHELVMMRLLSRGRV